MPQADRTVNTPRREQRAARRNRGTDDYCVNGDERLSVPRASANLNDSCEFAANHLTGVADWQHTHEEDRRIGLVHGLLNGLATGLYIMSWLDRPRDGCMRSFEFAA